MRRFSMAITMVAAGFTSPNLLHSQACLGQPLNVFNFSLTSQNASTAPMYGRLSLSVDNSYAAFTLEQRTLPGSRHQQALFGLESTREVRSTDGRWAGCARISAAFSRQRWDRSGNVAIGSRSALLGMGVAIARRVQVTERLTLLPNAGVYIIGGGTTYRAASSSSPRPANKLRQGALVTAGLSLLLPGNFSVQPHLQLVTTPELLANALGVSLSYGFFTW